jgi:hypothetical protein
VLHDKPHSFTSPRSVSDFLISFPPVLGHTVKSAPVKSALTTALLMKTREQKAQKNVSAPHKIAHDS